MHGSILIEALMSCKLYLQGMKRSSKAMETANHPPTFARLPRVAFVRRYTLHRAVLLLALWYDRHLQRHDLALLDTRMLRDLGLDADEARRECAKPFWR
jgi:uncharacterized protein YjiS (DUF1127 family)